MGTKITEIYNADTSAGDRTNLSGNEIIVFDPDPSTSPAASKGMTLTQLRAMMDPTFVVDSAFRMKVEADSLAADIEPISGLTYTHYAIIRDSTTQPIIGGPEFKAGNIPTIHELPDYLVHTYYLYVHDGAVKTQVLAAPEMADADDGVIIKANDTSITGITTTTSWDYKTQDLLATITAASYFDSLIGILRAEDIINVRVVNGSDVTQNNYIFRVLSATTSVVIEQVTY